MNSRTRIKMCGITRIDDAVTASAAGADALGFVFYAPSPRNIEVSDATSLIKHVPPFVTTVALFMNPEITLVNEVIKQVAPDVLQFHGGESAEFCEQFQHPYIKAVPMGDALGEVEAGKALIKRFADEYPQAKALLLDSHSSTTAGGSGKTFAWESARVDVGKPLIIAGGLGIENVKDAIDATNAYAVDVSSGIEVTKGVKDAAKMQAFADQVNLYKTC